MRIAGYGMLDAYESMAAAGYKAVVNGTVDAERERRADWAADDADERFWRLREEVAGEAWVGGYFDALPAVAADQNARAAVEAEPDRQVALGLVGGFAVDPPYE